MYFSRIAALVAMGYLELEIFCVRFEQNPDDGQSRHVLVILAAAFGVDYRRI